MPTINRDGSITVDSTGLQPAIRSVTPHGFARGAVTVSIGLDLFGSPEPYMELLHLSANRLQLRRMAEDLIEQLDAAEVEVLRRANLPQPGHHGG